MAKDATAKKAAKKAARKPAGDATSAPAAPKPSAGAREKPPVEKRRVVFPKDVYEGRKDEIKAPFKEHGLRWQYLGDGKGRYHKDGVNVFAQFEDDGVHYSLWGEDRATLDALLRAWETLLGRSFVQQAEAAGQAAAKAEEEQKESDAMRLWRLQEPQRRPGEPDFFFRKRVEEWQAKKPA